MRDTEDVYSNRPPWEWPGAVRRDCEPHRGPLLLVLGTVSLIFGVLGFWLQFMALPDAPLGLVVWLLAWRDLRRMRAGRMDPDGETATSYACRFGFGGALASIFVLLVFVWLELVPMINRMWSIRP